MATTPPRRHALSRLRTSFFAQAGEVAHRYHITFDRLITHLWHARRTHRQLLLRSVTHVEDLVHAIACVDGVAMAWSDLGERYERALIRRCRGYHDEIEATIFVRRLFAKLRPRGHDDLLPPLLPSLRSYAGTRPLRNWLADRLNAARIRQAWVVGKAQPIFPVAATSSRPFLEPCATATHEFKFSLQANPLRFVPAARPAHIAQIPCQAATNIAK